MSEWWCSTNTTSFSESLAALKKIETEELLHDRRKLADCVCVSSQVAPWSGDIFLGQVIISFNHIESQGLAHGGVQGQTPATSYVLADERGKQEMSTLQLQFTCSCERFYRYNATPRFKTKVAILLVEECLYSL